MKCPVVENEAQAWALGKALEAVLHFDSKWAWRVFVGDPKLHWQTGPKILNDELQSQWGQWTQSERERILALYTAEMLSL